MSLNGNSMRVDQATGFLEPSKNYQLTGFNSQTKEIVVNFLKDNYNISAACAFAGIDRNTLYNALRIDPAFKQAIENAREQHLDDLENMMFRNGKTEKGTADRIFALKSWRKERYGDKTTVEHSTKKPVDDVFSQLEQEGKLINVSEDISSTRSSTETTVDNQRD